MISKTNDLSLNTKSKKKMRYKFWFGIIDSPYFKNKLNDKIFRNTTKIVWLI